MHIDIKKIAFWFLNVNMLSFWYRYAF